MPRLLPIYVYAQHLILSSSAACVLAKAVAGDQASGWQAAPDGPCVCCAEAVAQGKGPAGADGQEVTEPQPVVTEVTEPQPKGAEVTGPEPIVTEVTEQEPVAEAASPKPEPVVVEVTDAGPLVTAAAVPEVAQPIVAEVKDLEPVEAGKVKEEAPNVSPPPGKYRSVSGH